MDPTLVLQKGHKETGWTKRKQLGLAATDGKKPLPFCAYKQLAKILLQSDKPEHVAAHTFLLLEWNQISWADYVVDSNIYLVSFQQDALMFDIGKNK